MDSTLGTVVILLIGVLIVIGSILALRLHAFLALVFAALVVSLLTPLSTLDRYHLEQASSPAYLQTDGTFHIAGKHDPGLKLTILKYDSDRRSLGTITNVRTEAALGSNEKNPVTLAAVIPGEQATLVTGEQNQYRAIHPFEHKTALKNARQTIGARVATGFGNTCIKIGILIAMAGIIGKCLLESGAADRIVRTALKWFGEPGAPIAFVSSGFLLGVPVFFDTVFYLMIPLGKAMRLRTGRNYLLFVLTIVCGATMAHSLVPPTPGPLLVAEELGVDLGTMILVGSAVGLVAITFGYFYALTINRYCELPLRDTADFSLEKLEAAMQVKDEELPSLSVSLLPILLPVVLIAGKTILNYEGLPFKLDPIFNRIASTLGDKNIALTLSAAIAMVTLVRQKRPAFAELADSIQAALSSAGVIILITAAGGAFGAVLRQTGVADLIKDLPAASPQMICVIAFLITTAIRTAQGSASVAMITAAGILSGIVQADMGFHPVYLAAAIGCGSKPIAWMNDSGFWVITKMSGMTEAEGLKFITPMTASMAVAGLLAVLAGVSFWPNL